MSDKWIKCIAQGGNLIATAVEAKDLISDAQKRHKLGKEEITALGETLIASLLLVSNCKKHERLSVTVKGSHRFRHAISDANPDGTARGYLSVRDLEEIPEKYDPSKGFWQEGLLTVVRLKDDQKEPYTGTVPLITGHLSKDLTFYLSQSEQVPSAVGIAVNTDEDGNVTSAGGFMVQVLPGASKVEILMVENNIAELQSLAKEIEKNSNPTALLGRLFSDLTFTLLEEKKLEFKCNCSRSRVIRAISMVGPEEIQNMIDMEKNAEVHCDFCGRDFMIYEKELRELLPKQ